MTAQELIKRYNIKLDNLSEPFGIFVLGLRSSKDAELIRQQEEEIIELLAQDFKEQIRLKQMELEEDRAIFKSNAKVIFVKDNKTYRKTYINGDVFKIYERNNTYQMDIYRENIQELKQMGYKICYLEVI